MRVMDSAPYHQSQLPKGDTRLGKSVPAVASAKVLSFGRVSTFTNLGLGKYYSPVNIC